MAQFCYKLLEDSLVWNQYSHWVDVKVKFYYTNSQSCLYWCFESSVNHAFLSIQMIYNLAANLLPVTVL